MAAGAVALALLVTSIVLTRPAFDDRLEGGPLDGLSILPLEQGLTLARVLTGGAAKLVIVRGVSSKGLRVVDVGAALSRPLDDPLTTITSIGLEQLEHLARTGEETLVRYEDLGVPLPAGGAHIAAGTNYAAHAKETGIEDGVFLFPKLSAPTGWNAPVRRRGRFDYEAELCAVPLTPVLPDRPAAFGYMICNDFTDRWPLVRDIDFDQPLGTTGFAEGKGGPGMMPLGPFLVVPRDDTAFCKAVRFELFVNGRLRQRSSAALMIWSPAEIAAQALKACRQDYRKGEELVRLTGCESIPAGTILLTGTPAGVLFHPATIWNPLAYLQSGDEVLMRAPWLGVLQNRVE
jgi:2-keto-4-pentenoate hydratase/2-oxohepta-3-ene-1,7-dioic acid hydratase in catechol pathway